MFSQPKTLIGDENVDVMSTAIDEVQALLLDQDIEVVIPAGLVLDVLLIPSAQVVRDQFRDFCLSNLESLPIEDLKRDRLRRLINTGA